MNLVKKFFVFALMIATVASLSVGSTFKVKAAGSYSAGSLLALAGQTDAAVYYIGSDGMKYVFPDAKTYFTWYENFDNVVKVAVSELDMYDDGGAVTYRPGTKLIKHINTAKTFAVSPGGVTHWIPDEATAIALYGADWAKLVQDVIPGYFSSSYDTTSGADLTDTLPDGTLAMETGGTTIYYIESGAKRPFASADAFEANNFQYDFVLTTDLSGYTDGSSVTGEEAALATYMPGEDANPGVVDGDLTISLYNTPDAASIPELSSNDFLGLKLTAGSSAASVESITLTSYGTGSSSNLDDVTIYQDNVKLLSSKNVNSDRKVTFNFATPLAIAANSSVTLVVKASLATGANVSESYGLGIAAVGDVITGGTVGGSFPLQGNLMTDVAASIGTAVLSGVTNDTSSVNFGEDNVLLGVFTLTAGPNEPLLWETARFRNGGTNGSDVVGNLRIEVDGDIVDEGVSLMDKYVNFDMGSLLIPKSTAVSVEVYGDIGVATVGNTIDLYIDSASDFGFMGETYGYGLQITSIASLDEAGDGITATLAAGDFTIDMDKTVTPNKDVKAGDDDVVLATISFTSNGETATINDISNTAGTNGDFYISGTNPAMDGDSDANTQEVTNFELRDVASGVLYDVTGTVSTTLPGWTLVMADEINLAAGVTKTFELRVDLSGASDDDSIENGDTLQVTLEDGAINVTGDDSDALISDITPSSVSSAVATVRDGSLTITTIALTNQQVVGGSQGVVVYKAGLEVGESSDITLSSYRVDVDDTNFASFKDDNISQLDLYIIEGGVARLLKSTSNDITGDGLATAAINFTSLDSNNRVLKAGVDVELEIRANFAGTLPTTGAFELEAVDTTTYIIAKDSDNTDVVEAITNATVDSRLVTLAAKGTLKAELKTTSPKANDDMYILASTETVANRYLAELVFTTANEAIELNDLALEEYGDSTGADVKVIKLYNSAGTVVAYKSPTAAGHVHFEEADFIGDANILPADQATSFFVGALTKSINADGDTEGTTTFDHAIQYSFATDSAITAFTDLGVNEAVKATGVNSAATITIIEDTNGSVAAGEYSLGSVKSKTAYITGSVLNAITNDMSNGTLSGGNNKIIGEYKFYFNNASNRTASNTELMAQLRTLVVSIATSTGVYATNVQAYIEGDSGNLTTAVQPDASTKKATISLLTLDTDTNLVDGEITLVIIADLSVVGADQYIQTEIADLTTEFTYNGNNGDPGDNYSNALLDGVTQVTGGTLSN